MTYGITPDGFNKKPLEIILSDIEARQKASYGEGLDVAPATALGQLNGILSSDFAEFWELLEECFHGADPEAAAGYLLTALSALTGTTRRAAAPSTVPAPGQTFNLNAGASIPAGSLVARANRPDIVFKTIALIENTGGSTANIFGALECITTGPVLAPAGTLTVIVNPVSGWNSTTNTVDASAGRDVDSDTVLRQRREQQLQLRGGSTVGGIRADLLDVDTHPELANMRDVDVLENTTDSVLDGMPPHSVEAVIDDDNAIDDDLIAQIIWDSKAGGIKTTGSASGTATDAKGQDQIVRFSRVTLKPVYIDLTVDTNDDYPADGDTQVKEALAAFGTGRYFTGSDVVALALRAAALIPGVVDVPVFELGFSSNPTGTTNLAIAPRERATFSTARITVSH